MDITFDKYVDLCEKVYNRIDKSKKYEAILTIRRGGIFLGDFLSRKLNLDQYFIQLHSYEYKDRKDIILINSPGQSFLKYEEGSNFLLVDDIYDSGETIRFIQSLYHFFNFVPCVLVTRGLVKNVISAETLFDNNWVNFWWETITNAEGK